MWATPALTCVDVLGSGAPSGWPGLCQRAGRRAHRQPHAAIGPWTTTRFTAALRMGAPSPHMDLAALTHLPRLPRAAAGAAKRDRLPVRFPGRAGRARAEPVAPEHRLVRESEPA